MNPMILQAQHWMGGGKGARKGNDFCDYISPGVVGSPLMIIAWSGYISCDVRTHEFLRSSQIKFRTWGKVLKHAVSDGFELSVGFLFVPERAFT